MIGPFSRTELLIGSEAIEELNKSTVAVFGVGGVGSYTVEALARSGVGRVVLVDADDICTSNINRQIHATIKTVGRAKVEAMAERIKEINPKIEVFTHKRFYSSETAEELLSAEYDYVVDAIDTISAKIDLVVRCNAMNIPIISSMGAGNKLDPTKFQVMDLYKTTVCPLAKVMRYELRKRGINKLKVVCSTELPIKPLVEEGPCDQDCGIINGDSVLKKRQTPGSISFVPSVVGLIIAGEVIKDLIHKNSK